MSSDWPLVCVEDVCELIVDCVNKTAPVVPEVTPYRMIRTTNVRNGRVDISECRYVEKETYDKWTRRAKLEIGDVILTREAPIGEVGFVTEAEGVFLGQRLMQYRADPAKLDSRFLLYSFLSPELQHQFGSHEGSGSVVSHIRVGDCFKFKLKLPPLKVQQQIGSFLRNIDEKIALLRETNATLEAIAQALFKSWFVDFAPVHANVGTQAPSLPPEIQALFPATFTDSPQGPIPDGWRWKTLDEAYEINPKRLLKKGVAAKYLDMASVQTKGHVTEEVVDREFGSGTKFCNGDTLLARITPCLENGKTAFVDFLGPNETGWGSTEFVVLKPKAPLPDYHGYLLARQSVFREFAIRSMSGTSGRQRVQNDVLGSFNLAIPDEQIAKAFAEVVSPIQQSISANHRQAKTLASLRDTLLPRLISGQLKLPHTTARAVEVN